MSSKPENALLRSACAAASFLLCGPLGAQSAGVLGSIGEPTGSPVSLHWGDFDGDELEDALAVLPGGALHLLRNLGDGTFENATQIAGLDQVTGAVFAVWGDYDANGTTDLFVGTQSGPSHLLQNHGGTFSDVAGQSGILTRGTDHSAHFVDYDSDGRLDLHVLGATDNTLYHALEGGGFESIPLPVASGSSTADPGTSGIVTRTETTGSGVGSGIGSGTGAPADGIQPNGAGSTTTTPGNTGVTIPTGSGNGAAASFVTCVSSLSDANGGGCIQASATPTLGMLYPLGTNFMVDSLTGNVGLGTTNPHAPLHIAAGGVAGLAGNGYLMLGQGNDENMIFDTNRIMARNSGALDDLSLQPEGGAVRIGATTAPGTLSIRSEDDGVGLHVIGSGFFAKSNIGATPGATPSTTGTGVRVWFDEIADVGNIHAYNYGLGGGERDLVLQDSGLLGVGGAPEAKLHVLGSTDASPTSHGLAVFGAVDSANIVIDQNEIMARLNGATSPLYLQQNGGFVGINMDGAGVPTTALDVNGAVTIRGGADIVENFESSCGIIGPGTVVVIDPSQPGRLMCSAESYDAKVAGVVSGAGGVRPGISLGQDGMLDGNTPVAMAGRVYVKASTENGAIQPGDLLTTASLEGHAMKATDSERAFGTVIGKAMGALDDSVEGGTGLVLVLVNLQ